MRPSRAFLVVVDISGYTRFITERTLTLAHAEQVITDLINAVLDRARHPMVLNKLEGDAALLFREAELGNTDAARDVFAQVRDFFPAFHERLVRLRAERSHCNCDACSNIADLKLKAFVHVGDIVIKQVRQFEELAGEPVILVHRMMKNSVDRREYVLATEEAVSGAAFSVDQFQVHDEDLDGFGTLRLWLIDSADIPEMGIEMSIAGADQTHVRKTGAFLHLPAAAPSIMNRFRTMLSHIKTKIH